MSDTARVVAILVTLAVCWMALLFGCSLILGRADVTLTPRTMEKAAPVFLWLGVAAFTVACVVAVLRLLQFVRRCGKPDSDNLT